MHKLLSPRRRTLLKVLGAATLASAGCTDPRSGPGVRPREFAFGGPTMGTRYTAKVAAPRLTPTAQAAAREALRLALETVNLRMSTYLYDSELTRLNRHADDAPFALSPDTLAGCSSWRTQVSERSGGAFDVTIGPVVDAWGFGPNKLDQVPPEETLRTLGARVGYRMLTSMRAPDRDARRVPMSTPISPASPRASASTRSRACSRARLRRLPGRGGRRGARHAAQRARRALAHRHRASGRGVAARRTRRAARRPAMATSGDYRN